MLLPNNVDMGAGGSVEALPGAKKLQCFVAMKAFNLRHSESKTLAQQFQGLCRHDSSTGVDYMDCDALCAYLQIPLPRKDALIRLFNVQADNRVGYADFLRFLQYASPSLPRCETPSQQSPVVNSHEVPPPPSNNNQRSPLKENQLALLTTLTKPQVAGAATRVLTPGLWKKREITIQERIVEYTKIDDDGNPQHLIEKEKHQHEIIHMESTTGEFAHREITYFEQSEELNKEIVHLDTGKEEFVHLKSKDDEISHFESTMPQSRQPEACEPPPPSPTIKRDMSQCPMEQPETTHDNQ
ncbi:hypothetical protein H257_06783 [Aphanomyces astaci]|uniref:EF-hand domain-containing protein n=2 Tax=Aphanomyces astaci TaxID=112090 RepID=W4GMD2_APHAT|nr:hypothetical protein H257_06783 [Aphanomyces astaci]ETV80521.1 hypothetical protein H257_06783 [Aphanomyces astaci]|eukprot:XP_009830445.1 hypothetical protein H257_06783 [Aphanomyces astaci]